MQNTKDVVIIGAGAAGLMCAIEAGKRGRKVLVVEHSKKPAEKIRISGGGRCNFTNVNSSPENFLSQNPRFCISALKRYSAQDFIKLVKKYKIDFYEKTLGQLFCAESSKLIISMLLEECSKNGVKILTSTKVNDVRKNSDYFEVKLSDKESDVENEWVVKSESLVIATGGPSIPKMGASGFGYKIAEQFGLNIIKPEAALVPFLLDGELLNKTKNISGVSCDSIASYGKTSFREAMLFTHRGLSGPSILQISSYWQSGEAFSLNLLPDIDLFEELKKHKKTTPKLDIKNIIQKFLPKRLAEMICEIQSFSGKIADLSDKYLLKVSESIQNWQIKPSGTEGYRTAEVTIGGVDTNEISSKTFEAKKCEGLYFIGEVVDVTGWLGGYNFQWAWSSGFCAGQYV